MFNNILINKQINKNKHSRKMKVPLNTILCFACILGTIEALRKSQGCSKVKTGKTDRELKDVVMFTHGDKLLGPVLREYIYQVPEDAEETLALPMVLDLHGYTGSASNQYHETAWAQLGNEEKFIVVWPNGMADSPNLYNSWNCSMTYGPKGPICDVNREAWNNPTECFYSCPLCDSMTTCDFSSCYDDIGFIDIVIQRMADSFCVDLDQVHLSGVSNGGMFAYFVMSSATDAIGIATFNPVASSSANGFGTPPPDVEVNFSIVDFHGLLDSIIPFDDTTSLGDGPEGSVTSIDGYYYDRKLSLLQLWSEKMECEEEELDYPTPWDGQNDLKCLERVCSKGKAILRCFGSWAHEYPLPGQVDVSAKVAYNFMKNHPRV